MSCDCHVFMCWDCAKAYLPFLEPAIGLLGHRPCKKCGKVVDCGPPPVGQDWPEGPQHALVPTEKIIAKDGKLPAPLPEQPPTERAPLRIGIGFKGLACGPENPAAVIEKLNS